MCDGEVCAWHYTTRQYTRMTWRAGRITRLDPIPAPAGLTVGADGWLAPGLVDLQVNGYAGIDFQRDDLPLDDLLLATRRLQAAGCARYLLTLITDDWSRLCHRLRHWRALRQQSPLLQYAIAGWHLEGPFLSAQPGFHGTHAPHWMCDPTPAHLVQLHEITEHDPVLLTLAPERVGALDAIAQAVAMGWGVSLGHTDASRDVLAEAVRRGARGFTHLGNGCPRTLDRHDNILWRVLETPGLTVSLIPDGIHVSPPLFRLLHRGLAPDRIYYITDAMAAAGMPPGQYQLGALTIEVGPDQVVWHPGRTQYAGSALAPLEGVFRAARLLSCPWSEAWSRFSEVPARLMGWQAELGVGGAADFCLVQTSAADACPALRIWVRGAEVVVH